MEKTDNIINLAKKKSEDKEKLVLSVIDEMLKEHRKITFYGVQKASGVSKSYMYKNARIREVITSIRDKDKEPDLSSETEGNLIDAMKLEIHRLKSEVARLQRDDLWEEKYKNSRAENEVLRNRIEVLLRKR
jgi:hypothetical protein